MQLDVLDVQDDYGCLPMLKITLDAAGCIGCLSMLKMTLDAAGCLGCILMHLDVPRCPLMYLLERVLKFLVFMYLDGI